MKQIFTILIYLTSLTIFGQSATVLNLKEQYVKRLEKNSLGIVDRMGIYVGDSVSKTLFYYALVPKNNIKGVLIILPSSGEPLESVINNNVKLTELACDSNILTILPSVNIHICLDTIVLYFLNATFSDVMKKYKVPKDKFIIGGLSLGGMLALRYTEQAYDNNKTVIIPKAVFGADPPVDLANLYYQFQREVDRNFSQVGVQEAKFYLKEMNRMFGGSPEQYPENYIRYSMYSRTEKDGGNTKFLKNIPVQIYSDPDIDWQMKNKHRDYYDMNAPDQTAMILQLNLMGNDKAEFINALGKGYRLGGIRHPHSWSIIEPTGFITWIMKCLE